MKKGAVSQHALQQLQAGRYTIKSDLRRGHKVERIFFVAVEDESGAEVNALPAIFESHNFAQMAVRDVIRDMTDLPCGHTMGDLVLDEPGFAGKALGKPTTLRCAACTHAEDEWRRRVSEATPPDVTGTLRAYEETRKAS
jgi:hypothetical protein